MHGDCADLGWSVITLDSRGKYAWEHGSFLAAILGDPVSEAILFLGLYFSDPNLQFILGQLRATFLQSPRTHHTIFAENTAATTRPKGSVKTMLSVRALPASTATWLTGIDLETVVRP